MPDTTSPRSDAQKEASRRNGAKSKGPNTEAGKLRSSQNATIHGLRGSRVVLSNESQEQYDLLLTEYTAEWNPVGRTESDLLVQLVNAIWRIRRIWADETAMFDMEMFLQKGDADASYQPINAAIRQTDSLMSIAYSNPQALDYFQRSEARLNRITTRCRKDLIQLQTMRLGNAPRLNTAVPVSAGADTSAPESQAETPNSSENTTNEPEIVYHNCTDPEAFSSFSRFVHTDHRPTTDRRYWSDPSVPHPNDKAA